MMSDKGSNKMSRKQKQRLGTIFTVLAVILIILVLDIGLITNFPTAFKSPFTISSSPPKWIFKPTLDNFRNVLGKGSFDFRLYLWNSFVIAVISSAIAIVLTIPAAYSIVRYHGFGDDQSPGPGAGDPGRGQRGDAQCDRDRLPGQLSALRQ